MTTEMLTYESAIESVKNNEQLKQSVFTKKYKYQDEATFEDTLNRMVKNLDIYLKKFDYPEKMLKEINFSTDCVRDGRFIPGGSILFGFGNDDKKNSLSNCYVTAIKRDSLDNPHGYGDGIGDTITKFMRTFSYRGGLGTDVTVLRPRDSSVNNAAIMSSGAVSFMPLFSEVVDTIGQCLAYDSLVLTKSGLKEIQHIVKNEEVWTKVGWVKVLDILKNKKKVFKLTTNNGFSIRASEDHVFQTLDKAGVVTEKPLRDFNINDRIVMIRGNSNEIIEYEKLTSDTFVKKIGQRHKDTVIPSVLDEKLAYLVGFSDGNGYVTRKDGEVKSLSVACGHKRPEMENKIISYARELFECEINAHPGDGAVNDVGLGNMEVCYLLEENGLLKSKAIDVRIPKKIFTSPQSVQCAYLSGLFDADGHNGGSKSGYGFTTISFGLATDIQFLLMSLGIITKIYRYVRKEENWNDLFTVSVTGNYNQEKFVELCHESIKVNENPFIAKRDNYLTIHSSRSLNIKYNNYSYMSNGDAYLTTGTLFRYDQNTNEIRMVQNMIKTIEEDEVVDTYDLVLEKEHLFWCNGFYVHNSGRRAAMMVSIDIRHPDVPLFIKSKTFPEEVFGKNHITNKVKDVNGANISVKITDEFMNAVINDEDWEFVFPDIDADKHLYASSWDGDYFNWNELGGKLKSYGKMKAREIEHLIANCSWLSADPGVIFMDHAVNNSPVAKIDKRLKPIGTNPCFTKDTLVAVADGREAVTFEKLIEEGNDVPVYCRDDNDGLVIRMMRNIRMTNDNAQIVKVHFDDGSYIKTTLNHKIYINGKGYVEVRQLKTNDSCFILTRNKKSFDEVINNNTLSINNRYNWLTTSKKISPYLEHREIYKFYNNETTRDLDGYHIHHIDKNPLNNSISNLEKLDKEAHLRLHAVEMMGENNPSNRFPEKNIFNNSEWQQQMREQYHIGATRSDLTKERIGLKTKERIKNSEYYTFWRKQISEKIKTEQYRKSFMDGLKNKSLNHLKKCQELTPHRCYLDSDLSVKIELPCSGCDKKFSTYFYMRDRKFCSQKCGLEKLKIFNLNNPEAARQTRSITGENKKITQIKAFHELRKQLTRQPMRAEWETFCKKNNIPARVGGGSLNRFGTFSELVACAEDYNHKVAKIEICNKEAVYNGTVDEFHNYFVGDSNCELGGAKQQFIAVKNCSEQTLADASNCLLGALVLFKYVDNPYTPEASFNHSLFFQDVSNAVVVMNVISDFNESRHPLKEQCEMDKYSKRIGIEFTGLGDFFAMMNLKYGSDECLAFLEPILRLKAVTEITTSCHLAKHMSCCEAMTSKRSRKLFLESSYIKNVLFDNKEDEFVKKDIMKYGLRNTAFNTVGPTGSISIMADNCTSGIEPCFAFSYTRKTIFDGGKDHVILHGPLVNHILKTHPEELENPVSVEEIKNKYNYVEAHELDYKTRIKVQSLVQKYTDSAVSSTINLPNNVTVDTIKEIYRLAWQSNLKGITVFRDGCKTGVLAKTIVTKDENDKLNIYEVNKPIELSDHMPSDRIIVRCNGKKIYATVTLDETRTYPLEIFVSPRRDVAIKNGVFDSMLFQEQLSSWTAVCRLVSLLLRTRAPLECIIDQLDKSSFTITDQYSAITRVLSYYLPKTLSALSEDEILEKDLGQVCPDCGKKTYVKEGGCGICKSCSYTTCG